MSDLNAFEPHRDRWLERLGALRNTVRQELVARQLAAHLQVAGARVLDVGAGQGTQALRLARLGHEVTAVDPDPELRDMLSEAVEGESLPAGASLQVIAGSLPELPEVVRQGDFDAVLCHGVLMYLPDPESALRELARCVAPGGVLSVLTRNAMGMALRPAVRRDWAGAQAALDELERARQESRRPAYANELGAAVHGDDVQHLCEICEDAGLQVEAWYGVRIAVDAAPPDEPLPEDEAQRAALLDVEERLGRTDPYRGVAGQVHMVAHRPHTPAADR